MPLDQNKLYTFPIGAQDDAAIRPRNLHGVFADGLGYRIFTKTGYREAYIDLPVTSYKAEEVVRALCPPFVEFKAKTDRGPETGWGALNPNSDLEISWRNGDTYIYFPDVRDRDEENMTVVMSYKDYTNLKDRFNAAQEAVKGKDNNPGGGGPGGIDTSTSGLLGDRDKRSAHSLIKERSGMQGDWSNPDRTKRTGRVIE